MFFDQTGTERRFSEVCPRLVNLTRTERRFAAVCPLRIYFSVSTRPLTNHFCIRMTTSAGGSMAKMAVAITTFHSV